MGDGRDQARCCRLLKSVAVGPGAPLLVQGPALAAARPTLMDAAGIEIRHLHIALSVTAYLRSLSAVVPCAALVYGERPGSRTRKKRRSPCEDGGIGKARR